MENNRTFDKEQAGVIQQMDAADSPFDRCWFSDVLDAIELVEAAKRFIRWDAGVDVAQLIADDDDVAFDAIFWSNERPWHSWL